MFYRNIQSQLIRWKQKSNRKPLILRGARQTGKTTAILQFSEEFDHFLHFNLERNEDLAIFEKKGTSIEQLVQEMFFSRGVSLDSKNVLIFIDEIQQSPKAITRLRYLYEDYPGYHVVGAGSLLETLLAKKASFPVGRVEYMYLHPVSFEEFLLASKEDQAADELRNVPVKPFVHSRMLELFHTFAMVGAMPEAIQAYVESEDIIAVKEVYDALLTAFEDDVEKYAKNDHQARIIRHVINTAPLEAGNRIKFAGFGMSAYSSREISECMAVLQKTMLIRIMRPVTSTQIPSVQNLKKTPKLMVLDSGFINHKNHLYQQYIGIDDLHKIYRGKIIEHLCVQEYIADSSTNKEVHFWVREKKQANSEIDLLHQNGNQLIPVEVKSGKQGTLRSLHQFVDEARHPYAIRLYAGPFSLEEHKTPKGTPFTLLNLPYYLASKIGEYCVRYFG